MARPLGPVGQLGERVANVVESYRSTGEAQRSSIRASLTSYSSVRATTKPAVVWVFAWGLAAAALLVVVLGWSWRRSHSALAFTVGASKGQLQAWLAAPEGSSMPLRFSDGSAFQVRPQSRVRVVDTAADGARIALERGELHSEVVPRAQGSWWIIAGPYSVHVTGTVFDVRWDPAAERFSIAVSRGGVTVTGPMAGLTRPVPAGYRLSVDLPQSRLEVTSAAAPSRSLDVPRPDVSSAVDPSDVARAESSATESDVTERGVARAESSATESDATERGVARNATVAERAEPEWRTLAKAGKLKEAFTSAESQGFARLCESASAPDLLLLGDAARLSGRPDRATLALQSLRNRFPSDSRRAAAAFALGKVAFDQRRTYSEAAKWFSTSLQEQPNGSLSREASGRLIEALRNAGDLVGAERAARSYLSKYPEGPHATVARAVLQ